jgi:hypothetical protein
MTTTTEKQPKAKQVPDFYIFENADGQKGGKPAGAAFAHKKGNGFTILIGGKRYAAFPPKAKTAAQPELLEQPAPGAGA